MKHFVFLGIGIAITLVFFILSYSQSFNIFEQLYFNQGFNDQLYNLSMYPVLALIMIILTWGAAALYYYVINSVNFDRWYHWAGVLGITTLVSPIVCYLYIDSALKNAGLAYGGESVQFAMQLLLMSAVLFVVASFSMRWWSTNCRHTPIPQ